MMSSNQINNRLIRSIIRTLKQPGRQLQSNFLILLINYLSNIRTNITSVITNKALLSRDIGYSKKSRDILRSTLNIRYNTT